MAEDGKATVGRGDDGSDAREGAAAMEEGEGWSWSRSCHIWGKDG